MAGGSNAGAGNRRCESIRDTGHRFGARSTDYCTFGPLKSPSTAWAIKCVTSPFSFVTNSTRAPENENDVAERGTIRPLPIPGKSTIN